MFLIACSSLYRGRPLGPGALIDSQNMSPVSAGRRALRTSRRSLCSAVHVDRLRRLLRPAASPLRGETVARCQHVGSNALGGRLSADGTAHHGPKARARSAAIAPGQAGAPGPRPRSPIRSHSDGPTRRRPCPAWSGEQEGAFGQFRGHHPDAHGGLWQPSARAGDASPLAKCGNP